MCGKGGIGGDKEGNSEWGTRKMGSKEPELTKVRWEVDEAREED